MIRSTFQAGHQEGCEISYPIKTYQKLQVYPEEPNPLWSELQSQFHIQELRQPLRFQPNDLDTRIETGVELDRFLER